MAFRSSSQLLIGGSQQTSAAVPVPAGAAVGDVAVVGIYIEGTQAITPPSGFTQKASLVTSASARGGLVVFWKRLSAADSGTYSFTWTGAAWRAGVCGLWSGRVASGDPFDGTVGTAESTVTVATLNVSTSPAGANGDAVGFWTNFAGGNAYTAPTNYTERQDIDTITLDSRDAVVSGSTGSISATSNTSGFQKAFLGVLAVASSGTTGTIAVTQASDTSAATGQLGYSGTSAATQAANTASATGTVVNPVTGTVAVTQANQTASASGQLGYSGTVAGSQAAQTASASGTYTAGGSFSGTIAVTQANQTASATGKLGYSGTVAVTQAANTSTATGLVANAITGTVAALQANQTAVIVGQFAGLVTFGTASAGAGTRPTAQGATATTPTASAAAAGVASASSRTVTDPTATGG